MAKKMSQNPQNQTNVTRRGFLFDVSRRKMDRPELLRRGYYNEVRITFSLWKKRPKLRDPKKGLGKNVGILLQR